MVLNLGIWLEDFAVEVLAYIFKFCSIQDRLKIACVRKRFKDVIDSTGEIWRTFNTDDELTVHQFDLVIVKHSNHLNHVSLRFSQKCVRYNSPDLYIESALAMCKHLTYLDLSYNTSATGLYSNNKKTRLRCSSATSLLMRTVFLTSKHYYELAVPFQ